MKDAEMEQKQLHKVVCINQQLETITGPEYCWKHQAAAAGVILNINIMIFNAGLEYSWSSI